MLSAERLREALSYEPMTGLFTRLLAFHSTRVGEVAGGVSGRGYWFIKVDGIGYPAHRLAWFYMMGAWPPFEIDHIDGDRLNNRFSNLRQALRFENGRNRDIGKNNTSGFKGVSWDRRREKWRASIQVHGRSKHLGSFDAPEAASLAYAKAAEIYFGEFVRKPAPIRAYAD